MWSRDGRGLEGVHDLADLLVHGGDLAVVLGHVVAQAVRPGRAHCFGIPPWKPGTTGSRGPRSASPGANCVSKGGGGV